MSKKLQIIVDDDFAKDLERTANSMGLSVSAYVRWCLHQIRAGSSDDLECFDM